MPLTPNDNESPYDDADDALAPTGDELGDFVNERPLAALAIAAAIGFVIGRLVF